MKMLMNAVLKSTFGNVTALFLGVAMTAGAALAQSSDLPAFPAGTLAEMHTRFGYSDQPELRAETVRIQQNGSVLFVQHLNSGLSQETFLGKLSQGELSDLQNAADDLSSAELRKINSEDKPCLDAPSTQFRAMRSNFEVLSLATFQNCQKYLLETEHVDQLDLLMSSLLKWRKKAPLE